MSGLSLFRGTSSSSFFFHWHYSLLWALTCWTTSFHLFLSDTVSLRLLNPSTWRSPSTCSFHLFLGLPLRFVPSSCWLKIFLGILSPSILSRCPSQLILCPFIHFTIVSPLLISSSSKFVLLFILHFYFLARIFFGVFSFQRLGELLLSLSSSMFPLHMSPLVLLVSCIVGFLWFWVKVYSWGNLSRQNKFYCALRYVFVFLCQFCYHYRLRCPNVPQCVFELY